MDSIEAETAMLTASAILLYSYVLDIDALAALIASDAEDKAFNAFLIELDESLKNNQIRIFR